MAAEREAQEKKEKDEKEAALQQALKREKALIKKLKDARIAAKENKALLGRRDRRV